MTDPASNPIALKRERNRLENARALIKHAGGAAAFARKVGKAVSTISQMTGPNPSRAITTDTARNWETIFGLPEKALDFVPGHLPFEDTGTPVKARAGRTDTSTPRAPAAPEGARDSSPAPTDVADIVNVLTGLWGEFVPDLPQAKFGEVAAYAIAEMAETGRAPTHASLRRLVALLRLPK